MARVNHSQIAAAAGVSRSTVSRALQNHPALPAATRKKLQALARKMGYRPNPLVSALMAARNQPRATAAGTLAILTAWAPRADLAPLPTDRRYLSGAKRRAEDLGFGVEEFWLDEPGLSGQRLNQILVARGIVAILIAPLPFDHPKVELQWEHFSLAAFAPSRQLPVLHRASHFHFQSCLLAVRQLLALGYRRPGLIVPPDMTAHVRDQWVGSYYAACGTLPTSRPRRDLPPPLLGTALNAESVGAWSARHRPDVVLSNEIRVPDWLGRAVSFANLDRHPENLEMAGIDQMHEIVGSSAVDLIVAQINRNERGVPVHPKDVLTEGRWVGGPSAPAV